MATRRTSPKTKAKNRRPGPPISSGPSTNDKRRKHRHWQVTVFYHDGEKFARVYIDRERALRFADRQKKSPIIRSTRVTEVD